jgi:ketopantoate reductase
MQLESMLTHIQPHIHDTTIMVCTMNGLKHEDRIVMLYHEYVAGYVLTCSQVA